MEAVRVVNRILFALPVAVLAVLWTILLGTADRHGRGDWRDAFLRAAVVWGTLAAVSAELLSPFGAIRQVWLGAFWALVLALAGGLLACVMGCCVRPGLTCVG